MNKNTLNISSLKNTIKKKVNFKQLKLKEEREEKK